LHKTVLERQAHALRIPIRFYAATWDQYEITFLNALAELKQAGIQKGVFGDINSAMPEKGVNRQWADRICAKAHIAVDEPLWEDSTESILQAFLEAGFVAKIIVTQADVLSADYLGRILDAELIAAFTKMGIDPAGERGEYHTVVIDGPIFKEPLHLEERMRVLRDGCWFLDVF
jgi:uncharacterized protein (TIGR00290 family)